MLLRCLMLMVVCCGCGRSSRPYYSAPANSPVAEAIVASSCCGVSTTEAEILRKHRKEHEERQSREFEIVSTNSMHSSIQWILFHMNDSSIETAEKYVPTEIVIDGKRYCRSKIVESASAFKDGILKRKVLFTEVK